VVGRGRAQEGRKREIAQGLDPAEERRERREAPTMADLIERYRAERMPAKALSEPARLADETRMLSIIEEALGKRTLVADVHNGDLSAFHRKLTIDRGPIRANRVLAVASAMFSLSLRSAAGESKPWRDAAMGNPCRGVVPEPVRKWLDESIKKDTVASEVLKSLAGMTLQPKIARPQGRLKFVSLSERARAEVMLEQHQPGLIDRLIRSSIGNTQFQSESARALFELMVPNDLKDGLGQLSRVVFVVDGETSRYPWELMTDADRPLCTRIGMVRQLQSAEYRSWIRATTGKTAYVVGDPLVTPPFHRLPGARREAELVTALLAKNDFTPTVPADPPTALTVLGGLLAQPYRIVHLAGHGHYEGPDAVDGFGGNGMVLDNGTLLTAAELRKMTQVPELVFLNCCFIGQTGPSRPAASRDVEYNRLAASVSRELIEMGVRAVVASGWAVRDDAALVFAQAFYEAMLGGATFGRALQTARERTWTQYPDVNTWGAYQAYGDPDFRLITLRAATTVPSEQVAPEELLEEITHIGRNAQNYASS
jgi:hypothetical protein